MKVLLDHNLPHKLRDALGAISSHDVVTTGFMGWGELMNGQLLRAAEDASFDVFVTGDRTLVFAEPRGQAACNPGALIKQLAHNS